MKKLPLIGLIIGAIVALKAMRRKKQVPLTDEFATPDTNPAP